MNENIIKKTQNYIFHNKLLQKGDGIVIGISGGPDSVALAKVLVELQKKYELKLSLLHVNYGLRGKDSERDEQFVSGFAAKLDLPLKIIKYVKENEGNLEQQLREFRFREFEKERKNKGYDLIAVGHTLDDQAETVLMKIFRGAGIKGGKGMIAKRGKIIRPLLRTTKQEIVEYLQQSKQSYRIDQSNRDEHFLRNKIRNSLIPMLERDYNPKIKKAIAQFAENLSESERVIDEYVEKTYNDIARQGNEMVSLSVDKLKGISKGLAAMIFRKGISQIMGSEADLERAHFFEFQKVLYSVKGKNPHIEIIGVKIEKKGGWIELSKS